MPLTARISDTHVVIGTCREIGGFLWVNVQKRQVSAFLRCDAWRYLVGVVNYGGSFRANQLSGANR